MGGVVWVVLGVVFLAQVPAVALPLLLPVLKPPPGPPKPPPGPPKTPLGPIYDFNRKISRNHKIVFFLVFCYFSWDFPIFLFGGSTSRSSRSRCCSSIRSSRRSSCTWMVLTDRFCLHYFLV